VRAPATVAVTHFQITRTRAYRAVQIPLSILFKATRARGAMWVAYLRSARAVRSFTSLKLLKLAPRPYKLSIFYSYIAHTNESNPYNTYFLLQWLLATLKRQFKREKKKKSRFRMFRLSRCFSAFFLSLSSSGWSNLFIISFDTLHSYASLLDTGRKAEDCPRCRGYNAHCYQSFYVSRDQLRITGGSPFNTAERQKPTIRSGNKCLEDSAFSKEVDMSNIL